MFVSVALCGPCRVGVGAVAAACDSLHKSVSCAGHGITYLTRLAQVVAARLGPVSAGRHVAPHGRAVAGCVVERPPAGGVAAGLPSPPPAPPPRRPPPPPPPAPGARPPRPP